MAASDDDDEDVRRGRAITSGKAAKAPTAPAAPAEEDPDVVAGRAITTAPPPAATPAAVTVAPPAEPSWTWRGLGRNLAAEAVNVGTGVINTLADPYANLVGRPALTAFQFGHDFLAPHLGYARFTPEERSQLFADFGMQPGNVVSNALARATGVNPADVTGTPTEKMISSTAGGAAMGTMLGPFSVPAAIAGAGAGAAGEAVRQSDQVQDWAKPGAELVANVAGAKAANVATNIGTKTVNAALGRTTPVAAAYDELGIDKSLIGDITGDPTMRVVQAFGSKSPFGASTVSPIEQKVVGQFGKAVEDTASRLGTSTSEQTAGEALQREARNWRDNVFPARQQAAWQPVDRLLGGEPVAPANYRTALSDLTSKLSGLPETAKALIPAKTWQLLDAINTDVPAGGSMPWQQAQALRSAIGQVMGVPEIVQSVGKDQLTRAYGGISQDMRDTAAATDARNIAAAGAAGTPPPPSAAAAFDNANKVSTDGHAFMDNTLSKIIRSNNPAQETIRPEQAARSALGSGDTTLQAIRKELPAGADELAAYKLRDMALATPGAAGRLGTETSVGSFLTDLNRLKQQNPAGFSALFADPTVARKIDAMATVADTMKETAKRANTSGTGPYMTIGQLALGIPTFFTTHDPWAAAAATAGPYVAGKTAGYVSTNPLASWVAGGLGARRVPPAWLTGPAVNELDRR